MSIPRSEYPRPQFIRKNWENLNGQWQFDYDDANKGLLEKWYLQKSSLRKLLSHSATKVS